MARTFPILNTKRMVNTLKKNGLKARERIHQMEAIKAHEIENENGTMGNKKRWPSDKK